MPGGLSQISAERIAPNLNLWRPILSEPSIYTRSALRSGVTLQDVMDAHEALDLKSAILEKRSNT